TRHAHRSTVAGRIPGAATRRRPSKKGALVRRLVHAGLQRVRRDPPAQLVDLHFHVAERAADDFDMLLHQFAIDLDRNLDLHENLRVRECGLPKPLRHGSLPYLILSRNWIWDAPSESLPANRTCWRPAGIPLGSRG